MLKTPKNFERTVPRCCVTCRWGIYTGKQTPDIGDGFTLTFHCERESKIAFTLDDDDQWLSVCARYRKGEMYK